MRSRNSLLAQWLEPFASGLWIFFLVWTLLTALVWTLGIGEGTPARWTGNRDLLVALDWLIGIGDIAWITLAAANMYLCIAEQEGLATARRWALIVGAGVFFLGAAGAWSGFPLGEIQYSQRLGVKIGPVPFGLPLLWFAIVIGARETALRLLPRASHARISLATGFLALLTDLNLEPAAAKLRAFWFWRAATADMPPHFTPPPMSHAAWFAAASALAFALREKNVAADPRARTLRPVIIFALMNAILFAARLSAALRR